LVYLVLYSFLITLSIDLHPKIDLFSEIDMQLSELKSLLESLDQSSFARVCADSGASIGQHLRHMVEIFTLLINDYDAAEIDYSLRARDIRIETDLAFATKKINYLLANYKKEDKPLMLRSYDQPFQTSYNRELLYQLEHIVHHKAIIKPIIKNLSCVELHEHFGYARSTINYSK